LINIPSVLINLSLGCCNSFILISFFISSVYLVFNLLSFTKTYGDSDITISATASSGLPISFSAGGACSNSGSTISITGAGTCTVTASQGGNASYNPAFDVARSFIVNKAAANCSVTGYNVTYTGTPHTATGSCTGVFSEPLSGLDLNNTRHTSAGDDFSSDSWSYPGDANYSSDSGSVSDNISKANGCNISGWSGAYDTSPHGATGSCQGAGTLDLGSSYTDAPGGSADWSYSGDINHNSQGATVSIIINKINGCSISGWSGAYDTLPHGATGSCQGAGTLYLGSSYTDAPGGAADWSYSGDTNYNYQSGSVAIIIY